MQGLDDADLGQRAAPSNDERDGVERVDLIVGETGKFGSRHDHVGAQGRVAGQNANFVCYGSGGFDVVARDHVHRDAGLAALHDGAGRFRSRGIIEARETEETQARLTQGALVGFIQGIFNHLVCNAEHAETFTGK